MNDGGISSDSRYSTKAQADIVMLLSANNAYMSIEHSQYTCEYSHCKQNLQFITNYLIN